MDKYLSFSPKKLINRVNRAIAICFDEKNVISNSNHQTQYLSITNLYKLESLKFVFKYKTNTLPSIFQNFLTLNMQVHQYNTRHKLNFQSTYARTKFREFSLKVSAPLLWNELPASLMEGNILVLYLKTKFQQHSVVKKYFHIFV